MDANERAQKVRTLKDLCIAYRVLDAGSSNQLDDDLEFLKTKINPAQFPDLSAHDMRRHIALGIATLCHALGAETFDDLPNVGDSVDVAKWDSGIWGESTWG